MEQTSDPERDLRAARRRSREAAQNLTAAQASWIEGLTEAQLSAAGPGDDAMDLDVPAGQDEAVPLAGQAEISEESEPNPGLGDFQHGDIVTSVARHLAPNDVAAFSRTSGSIRGELGNTAVAALWETRVQQVSTLAGIQGFLRDLRADLSQVPALMTKPMLALVDRLTFVPLAAAPQMPPFTQLVAGLNVLLDARTALPGEQRLPLVMKLLTKQTHSWAPPSTPGAIAIWNNFFNARMDLPAEHRLTLLTNLADEIWAVGDDGSPEAWQNLSDAYAEDHPEQASAWHAVFNAREDVEQDYLSLFLEVISGKISSEVISSFEDGSPEQAVAQAALDAA